jgi:transglutaminase/protease-like cytokinesis protein 3
MNAVVGDEVMIAYSSVKSYPNTATLPGYINKYQYAVVVRKNETELLAKINETIDRLKSSGELKALTDQWIGTVVEDAKKLAAADKKQDELKRTPKAINVTLRKTSGKWNMDRLDGFVLVLNGPTGQYQSTPILTEGNTGNCKFTRPVPPGDYRLNFSILGMTANVPVPSLAKAALTMDINIGNAISILFR